MSDIKAKRVHTVFVIRKLPKKGKKKKEPNAVFGTDSFFHLFPFCSFIIIFFETFNFFL